MHKHKRHKPIPRTHPPRDPYQTLSHSLSHSHTHCWVSVGCIFVCLLCSIVYLFLQDWRVCSPWLNNTLLYCHIHYLWDTHFLCLFVVLSIFLFLRFPSPYRLDVLFTRCSETHQNPVPLVPHPAPRHMSNTVLAHTFTPQNPWRARPHTRINTHSHTLHVHQRQSPSISAQIPLVLSLRRSLP